MYDETLWKIRTEYPVTIFSNDLSAYFYVKGPL